MLVIRHLGRTSWTVSVIRKVARHTQKTQLTHK